MRRAGAALLVATIGMAATTSGCSVGTTEIVGGGQAPTGVAPGPTLFFLDHDGDLTPQRRNTGRLGTVADAVSLLLTGPGDSDLSTDLPETDVTRVEAAVVGDVIDLTVPVSADDAGARGADQIACTAITAFVLAVGAPTATVRIGFTIGDARSHRARDCPVLLNPAG